MRLLCWRNDAHGGTLSRQPVYLYKRRVRSTGMEVWRWHGLWRWVRWRRLSYVTFHYLLSWSHCFSTTIVLYYYICNFCTKRPTSHKTFAQLDTVHVLQKSLLRLQLVHRLRQVKSEASNIFVDFSHMRHRSKMSKYVDVKNALNGEFRLGAVLMCTVQCLQLCLDRFYVGSRNV